MKTIGAATIKLRDGRVYVAESAHQTADGVTFTGRLKLTDQMRTHLCPPGTHFEATSRIESIEWHKGGRP